MSIKGSLERRELRKKTALVRLEERAKRSPQQQLEHLDRLFGVGLGAVKERFKLYQKIKGF